MNVAAGKIALALIVYFLTTATCGAEPIPLLQWTCIPGLDYLGVSATEMELPDYLAADPDREKTRIEIWRKNGFYDPQELALKCVIHGSVFELTAFEPPSKYTRGDPIVTLKFNGKIVLEDVAVGTEGAGADRAEEAVTSFEIWQRAGIQTAQMSLCFVNGYSDKKSGACTGEFGLVGGSSRFPIHGDLTQFVPPNDAKLYQIDGP